MALAQPAGPGAGRLGGMSRHHAFTLVEILVTVSIIAVLAGLLVPALNTVRASAKRTTAAERVATLEVALGVYRQEDAQRRFPPVEPDGTLRSSAWPPRNLDLLAGVGLTWQGHEIATGPTLGGALIDPWRQPYRYRCDTTIDGTAARPADLADWNARNAEPWAYVWSPGPPVAGTENGVGRADAWIYRRTMP